MMDIILGVIQFVVYGFSIKIFIDIWKNNRKIINRKKLDISIIIIGSILCVSLNILINTGLPFLNDWFASSNESANMELSQFIIISISSIFIAPLLEETFYRYYLYKKINSKLNISLSIIITSILFGIIHFYGIAGLISSICIGMVLQIIYLATKKLSNTIVIHAICNFTITIIGILSLPINNISLIVLAIIIFISFIAFFIEIKRKS